jgi:hypothetical protein
MDLKMPFSDILRYSLKVSDILRFSLSQDTKKHQNHMILMLGWIYKSPFKAYFL